MTGTDLSAALVGVWRLERTYVADRQGRRIGPAFGENP